MQNHKHSYHDSEGAYYQNFSHTLVYRHLWRGMKAAILGAGLVGIVSVGHILTHQIQTSNERVSSSSANGTIALTSGTAGLSVTNVIAPMMMIGGGTTTTLPQAVPGDVEPVSATVTNTGTIPLTLTASASATSNATFIDSWVGSIEWCQTGGTCVGPTANTSLTSLTMPANQVLGVGQSGTFTIYLTFPSTEGISAAGNTGDINIVIGGIQ